jgi:cell division protease FtsH
MMGSILSALTRGVRRLYSPIFIIAAIAVLVAGLISFALTRPRAELPATISYGQLIGAIQQRRVDSIQVHPGTEVRGWVAAAPGGVAKQVRIVYPAIDASPLIAAATAAGAGVTFLPKPVDLGLIIGIVASLAVILFMTVMVRKQIGRGAVDTEAGSTAGTSVTFQDVAGNTGAIADLREIVGFLKEPQKFAAMGARIPKGLLLEGPPGTGKTLMARALAGEAGVPCYVASGSDFTGTYVGQGVQRVKSLFKKARKAGGAVIFIDEIDTLGGRRGREQGHNEDDRTLNQFLVELDGFDPSVGVVVVGATNRVQDLDAALLRKGRFDRSVTVGLPTVSEREEILALHVRDRGVPLDPGVDLTRLARLMTGTTGAELAGLINEAAILAVKTGCDTVTWTHVEEARDRVLLGRAREGFAVSDSERRLVALHEAGHALAGVVFCPADPLHKVTIQPRGRAMGVAFFQPDHESHISSREYLEGQILKGLGGRAAEEVMYGVDRITSGAASDLQHTTRVAKQMVYRLGMGAGTGLMTYDPDSGPVSGDTHSRMDQDVRAILEAAYTKVLACVRQHRTALEALADALVDRETLTGAEAIEIMVKAGLPRHSDAA